MPPKSTLVDAIYSQIRKEIVQGVLKPGQKINVAELASRYDASQTPVKLALNRLMSENIIKNYPRQGMQVRQFTMEDVEEVFTARQVLDLAFVSQAIAAINYNDALRSQLAQNIAHHKQAVDAYVKTPTPETFWETCRAANEFHELYLKSAGSKLILDIYRFINPFLYENYIFRKQSPERTVRGVEEHKAILDAILQKDETAVRTAILNHHHNAKEAVALILRVDQMV